MALLQSVLAIILLLIATFGECVHVLLGDPVTFQETENCPTGEPAELYRVGEHSTSPVAVREHSVWTPAGDYKDRGNQGASFAFNSTVYTDTGLYELRCGSRLEEPIHLHVLVGFEESFYEGGPAKLLCYIKGHHVESVRWEKGHETVLEQNLSSGEIKYAPGFDGTLSLSPDGKLGDYTLIFTQVLWKHRGDYFCSAHKNGAREEWGNPAAVKLRVKRKNPDRTGTGQTHPPTKSITEAEEQMGFWAIVFITAAVVFLIVAPSFLLLGWYLKSWCSRAPPGSSGRHPGCGASEQ